MIPILNSKGQNEFRLVLGYNLLRCCVQIFKAFKTNVKAIEIYDKDSEQYSNLASFISNVFCARYKAEIKVTAPKIMAVIDQENQAVSALAIRPAAKEKLFLEQYLDSSIEEILSKKLKHEVKREEIVEIGSLASRKKHAAKFLYIALAAYLKIRNYKYVVVTGTQYLYDYFNKAHLHPIVIAKASIDKLDDKSANWGSYYESNPQVMVLNVDRSNMILSGFLGIVAIPNISELYPAISYR